MRKNLILLFVLSLLITTYCRVSAQNGGNEKPLPKLEHRYEKRLVGTYRIEEDAIDLGPVARTQNGRIAIRYCTNKPFSANVVYRSNVNVNTIINYAKTIYNLPSERILLLRSSGCVNPKNPKPKRAIMETWTIPEGADLPLNEEAIVIDAKGNFQKYEPNKRNIEAKKP